MDNIEKIWSDILTYRPYISFKNKKTEYDAPMYEEDKTNFTNTVNEFIVVEGDSAGGSAKQARDRRFQTIMPSKGKIMNTEKQKLENVLASEELKIFNTAIGTGTLDNYKEEDLKYDKIIIMSDADVDGFHSATRC